MKNKNQGRQNCTNFELNIKGQGTGWSEDSEIGQT